MKDVYKNRITLNLGKVHTKMSFNTTQNNVLNFGLICTHTDTHTHTHIHTQIGRWKKNNVAGNKTIHVLRLQNFINHESSWNNAWFKWNCGRSIKI